VDWFSWLTVDSICRPTVVAQSDNAVLHFGTIKLSQLLERSGYLKEPVTRKKVDSIVVPEVESHINYYNRLKSLTNHF